MLDTKTYYDDIPYFSEAFKDFSPVRLQAILSFLGFLTKELNKVRVLEIGCSYGGNIFPFALAFKDADVVGVDISQTQISKANELKNIFGIENIKFICRDISKLSQSDIKELGKFDFILAHGVFSWVNDDVKRALFKITKKLLAPDGMAQISYNVYPGWASLSVVREFMLFACRNNNINSQAVNHCAKELEFLSDFLKFSLQRGDINNKQIAQQSQRLLSSQLDFVREIIANGKNSYISHEFLEPNNTPIYFREFAKAAQDFGFSYLVDSSLDDIFLSEHGVPRFDNHIRSEYKDRLEKEQLYDFMLNRSFRRSILMHTKSLCDFKLKISTDNLSNLNYVTKFEEKEDRFYHKDQMLRDEYKWLYSVFNSSYPNSVSINDLTQMKLLCDENAIKSAQIGILEIMANTQPLFAPYHLNAFKYEPKKTRLKKRLNGYFKYFATCKNPVISIANELNATVNLDSFEASIALEFDGDLTIEQIADKISDKFEYNSMQKSFGYLSPVEYVKAIENKLSENYFFEYLKGVQ